MNPNAKEKLAQLMVTRLNKPRVRQLQLGFKRGRNQPGASERMVRRY